jgi:hypothetical protein
MENKNPNAQSLNKNLLDDFEFKALIKFETEYAAIIKGGHLPTYYTSRKQNRLVSDVNLLSTLEKVQLVKGIFTSKN